MLTLLVLRHAKSSWKHEDLTDHDRPLNKRGRRDAPRIGALIKEQELVPDEIFSSTAERARTTAEMVAEASGFAATIQLNNRLYLAAPEAYVQVVRHEAAATSRVMVVGHNPGVEGLVGALTGEHEAMPTAALAVIDLALDEWSQFGLDASGQLVNLICPKVLWGE